MDCRATEIELSQLERQKRFEESKKKKDPCYSVADQPYYHELRAIFSILEDSCSNDQIPVYLELAASPDLISKHRGIISIRKCLAKPVFSQEALTYLIRSEVGIPLLKQFLLTEAYPILESEALWCISNIASGTTEEIEFLLQAEILPLLQTKLSRGIYEIAENAIWAISNIGGDSRRSQHEVISLGIISDIVGLYWRVCEKCPKLLRLIIWCMSNICVKHGEGPNLLCLEDQISVGRVALDALSRQLDDLEPTINCFDIIKNTFNEDTVSFYENEKLLARISDTLETSDQPEIVVRWVRILGEFTVISDDSCQVERIDGRW